jgi:NitT/TauT family transport system substrate-binding protein
MKPDLKALHANIELQHQLGLVKASVDVAKHADLSVIEEAAKRIK